MTPSITSSSHEADADAKPPPMMIANKTEEEWEHLRRWCVYGVTHSWANELRLGALDAMAAANLTSTADRACQFSPAFRAAHFGRPPSNKLSLGGTRPFLFFCPYVSFGRREADARLALVRKGACAAHVRASTAVS